MPAINTKLVLSSAAQSANVVLADIDLIKGALYGVSTESDLDNINTNYLSDGQLMFVQDVAKFFSLTITLADPPNTFVDTYDWNEVTLGASGAITSDDTGSFVLTSQTGSFLIAADTASFITSDDTGSFILVSQTSSMSVATASFISDTFISASAARSGFGAGGGSIPSGTISGSQQITDFGFISSSVDISALNTFTGSIQTEVDSLTNATSSYLTADSTGSFITSDVTSSMSVATASYALYAVSASYEILTELSSSHAIQADTASFISDTFISASAVRSGFGSGGGSIPSGTISGSQQITDFGFISSSVDISALNEFSGSIQGQVDALIAATGSYLDDTNTILVTQSEPSATAGGIYFDGNNFYLGL